MNNLPKKQKITTYKIAYRKGGKITETDIGRQDENGKNGKKNQTDGAAEGPAFSIAALQDWVYPVAVSNEPG